MKTLFVYEPALCCETGVCTFCVEIDAILITSIAENLKRNGVTLQRYDPRNTPQEFNKNADINELISSQGLDSLPATIVDGKIVKTKEYPTAEEIAIWLNIPIDYCLRKDNNQL